MAVLAAILTLNFYLKLRLHKRQTIQILKNKFINIIILIYKISN